ncbi:MAG TPA: glycosyltransferase family 4 protein [Parvibaculum sp.]|jgi:glycosyltransferase involved in cell wall biosynthesis
MRQLCIIAFEFSPFPGGIASYASSMAKEAASYRRVTVIAPRYGGEADAGAERVLAHHKLTLRGTVAALRRIHRLERDAVLHAADIRAGMIGLCARLLMGRRYVVMAHGSDVSKFGKWSFSKLGAYATYRLADRVFSNSEHTKEIYERNFVSCAHCVAAPLGVGSEWFSAPSGAFENDALASLPDEAEVICTVGRLEPRKGHLLAIEAIADYQRRNPARRIIYVVGGQAIDEEYEARIKREAVERGVDARLVGRISGEDLKRLYRRAAMQLLCAVSMPGKVEGFGLVLLEGAAQGCPSVATRAGGIGEVVLDGESGILVERPVPSDIADAMARLGALKAGTDVARKCVDHARSFSWAETARRTYLE